MKYFASFITGSAALMIAGTIAAAPAQANFVDQSELYCVLGTSCYKAYFNSIQTARTDAEALSGRSLGALLSINISMIFIDVQNYSYSDQLLDPSQPPAYYDTINPIEKLEFTFGNYSTTFALPADPIQVLPGDGGPRGPLEYFYSFSPLYTAITLSPSQIGSDLAVPTLSLADLGATYSYNNGINSDPFFNDQYDTSQAILDSTMTVTFAEVPEPVSWATMLCGFGMIGGMIRGGKKAVVRMNRMR